MFNAQSSTFNGRVENVILALISNHYETQKDGDVFVNKYLLLRKELIEAFRIVNESFMKYELIPDEELAEWIKDLDEVELLYLLNILFVWTDIFGGSVND